MHEPGGMRADSTTGLPSRTASALAYLGWWVTGIIFWAVERRDALVRFHAVQATVAFAALTALIGVLALLGLVMLSFAPRGFTVCATVAAVLWAASIGLWLVALWQSAQGKRWRIPLAADLADAYSKPAGSR